MAKKRSKKKSDQHEGVQVKFWAPAESVERWREYAAAQQRTLSNFFRALADGATCVMHDERAKQ